MLLDQVLQNRGFLALGYFLILCFTNRAQSLFLLTPKVQLLPFSAKAVNSGTD
jgi:hypothetical protein